MRFEATRNARTMSADKSGRSHLDMNDVEVRQAVDVNEGLCSSEWIPGRDILSDQTYDMNGRRLCIVKHTKHATSASSSLRSDIGTCSIISAAKNTEAIGGSSILETSHTFSQPQQNAFEDVNVCYSVPIDDGTSRRVQYIVYSQPYQHHCMPNTTRRVEPKTVSSMRQIALTLPIRKA